MNISFQITLWRFNVNIGVVLFQRYTFSAYTNRKKFCNNIRFDFSYTSPEQK